MGSLSQKGNWLFRQTKRGKIPLFIYWKGSMRLIGRVIKRTIILSRWEISEISSDFYFHFLITFSSKIRTNISQYSMVVKSGWYLTTWIYEASLTTMMEDLLRIRTRRAYHQSMVRYAKYLMKLYNICEGIIISYKSKESINQT